MSGRSKSERVNKLRKHSTFSPPPNGPHDDYQMDMLPPLSCPRLTDRPRELRHFLCVLLTFVLLTAVIAFLIWLSGWVEDEFQMTSVYSTRELRPVPKLLVQMTNDPSSVPVIYHTAREDTTPRPTVTLLVLVHSLASNTHLRKGVRETWMTSPSVGLDATVVFAVAAKGLSADRLLTLQSEAERYGDIAIFPESSELPESEHLLYQLGWAQNTFSYQFLLRTKDRYYVRLDEIVMELQQYDPHSTNLYWGYFEGNRFSKERWKGKHDEPDWFLCSKFIRFAHSGGYVISQSLVQRLVGAADYLHLYQNEDIALATWVAPFGDVMWKHDVRFDTDPGQSRGCQNSFLIFPINSHGDMLHRHQRLAENNHVCRREHFLLQSHSYDFSVLPSYCCTAL